MDALVNYLVIHTRPDDETVLTIIRDGRTLDVTVLLGARPAAELSTTPDFSVPATEEPGP